MFRSIRFFIGLFFLSVGFAEGGVVLSPIVPAADGEAVGVESDAAAYRNGSGTGRGGKKGAAELGDKSEDGFGFLSGFAAGKPDDPVSENKIFKKGRVVGGNPKVKISQRFPHQPVPQIRAPEKGQEDQEGERQRGIPIRRARFTERHLSVFRLFFFQLFHDQVGAFIDVAAA